jgi:hypothetical protein
MASILDRYGIKEVADVTFYELNDNGTPGNPVLFLDTLKVSTIEQTASSSDARGGKGNAKLISWDFDKELNVTLEDALFSPKSLSIMFGQKGAVDFTTKTITKTMNFIPTNHDKFPGVIKDPTGSGYVFTAAGVTESGTGITEVTWYDETGKKIEDYSTVNPDEGKRYMCTFKVSATAVKTIAVDAAHFPGTYYIVGDTYARNDATGKDEFFQFVIYKAKVSPENTITLQADGDPSTFSMNLTVLRNPEGKMMDLIQYTV